MSDADRIAQAAQFLVAQHQAGATFGPIAESICPRTLDEAYAIQEAYCALTSAARGDTAGQKIALTTPTMRQMLGVAEPVYGIIPRGTIYESNSTLRAAEYGRLGVECEFAVRLEADLPVTQAPFNRERVADATDALMVAFELIDDRNADYGLLSSQLLSAVADNVWNAGIVLGPRAVRWREIDLSATHGTMVINGSIVGEGYGRDVMGHPLDALAWLANALALRGRQLCRGMVVMTGSIVPTKFVKAGDDVHFSVDGLGEVNVGIR
jgi:2-keto-4-pentenoate hydratase